MIVSGLENCAVSPVKTDIYGTENFTATGSKQTDVRQRNEKLVLTILRRQGPLPKAEIARRTGLSAQAASVIVRALEQDGLLIRGERTRGKIGQPSIPMQLAPDGAFFLGLKVGRRSAELILIDFLGTELAHIEKPHIFPTPAKMMEFVRHAVDEVCEVLPPEKRNRIAGMGIATPFFLWEWASVIGLKSDDMKEWRDFDLRAEIAEHFNFPVYLGNDATSACGAELTFGTRQTTAEFLYIYIGYFIGGGIVLNGALYSGHSGNAGAIGPFPIRTAEGEILQLVERASLIALERRLAAHRADREFAITADYEPHDTEDLIVDEWLAESAEAIAQLISGACSVIDFPLVIIDGKLPLSMKSGVIAGVSTALDALPLSGLIRPNVVAGTLSHRARALGAASLPLSKKFMLLAE